MVMQAFGFIFRIVSSLLQLPFTIVLMEGLSIGMFILVVFVVCYVINKIFGMARTEIEEYRSDRKEFRRKERESNLGEHAYYKPKHGGVK